MVALGIGPGDEVINPTMTHVACANMVTLTGARSVLVDSESVTWGLDSAHVEEKVTSRPRTITVVHLYGHLVEMDPIAEIAEKHGLPVIENAAETHGAEYKGRGWQPGEAGML